MKMGSRPEIVDAHERVAQLIPWLINGTLDAEEATTVRAHLAACPSCRADFESEERLYAAVRSDGLLVFSGEPSFQKLMARVEADDFAAAEAAPLATGAPPSPRAASRETAVRRAPRSNGTASKAQSQRRKYWRS